MTALLRFALPIFLVAGCLNGDFNGQDQGAPVPDLATHMFDIAGLDLFGLYNCTALNQCDQACKTPSCTLMCRNMATPIAKALESDLQSCFMQYCPTGAGMVCAPDAMGMLTVACMTCINNTYVASGTECPTPTQNPSECHQCLSQANACTADM
jgi:hypothetical protein